VTIIITPTVEPTRAHVELVVENTGTTPVTVTVDRSQWVAGNQKVRGLVNVTLPAGIGKKIVDGETLLDTPYSYSASVNGTTVATSPIITVPAQHTIDGVAASGWLKHPYVEALSVPILVQTLDSISRPSVAQTFLPYGAAYPVVSTLKRQQRVGSIILLTLTDASTSALIDAIRDGSPMLFTFRPEFGVTRGGFYASITDFTEERINPEVGEDPTRRFTLQWIEVAVTALDTALIPADQYNYTDLKTTFPTYQKLFDDRLKGTTYRTLLTYPAIP